MSWAANPIDTWFLKIRTAALASPDPPPAPATLAGRAADVLFLTTGAAALASPDPPSAPAAPADRAMRRHVLAGHLGKAPSPMCIAICTSGEP
jgi:hypothetical protein